LGDSPDREAYIRILLTRGIGELTYDPAATPTPSVVVIVKPNVHPPREVFERGVKVSLVGVIRNHPGTVNPLIKSNSLLNNALAMQEALRTGGFEGVMRNYKGELAECTQSNLFIVKDGAALTPPLDAGLLPGITREFLFEIGATAGIPVREAVLKDADLLGADEAFLTSTTREVVPIVKVDDRTVGTGKPGPVTQALLEAYRLGADALTAGGFRGSVSWMPEPQAKSTCGFELRGSLSVGYFCGSATRQRYRTGPADTAGRRHGRPAVERIGNPTGMPKVLPVRDRRPYVAVAVSARPGPTGCHTPAADVVG
jgi:branched-subunit amino acid aminotransferase/4-amino-4-deoxychorismate lyase